jgi:hypothetical protein
MPWQRVASVRHRRHAVTVCSDPKSIEPLFERGAVRGVTGVLEA